MEKLIWACTGSGNIRIEMTKSQAEGAAHQGQCDDDVFALSNHPAISKQLAAIDPEELRKELKEYGAWEDDELQDHQMNLQRILWLLAGDIAEGGFDD